MFVDLSLGATPHLRRDSARYLAGSVFSVVSSIDFERLDRFGSARAELPRSLEARRSGLESGVPRFYDRNCRALHPSDRFAGTIVGERGVYRPTQSARISSPSVSANRSGSGAGNRGASGMSGDGPQFSD